MEFGLTRSVSRGAILYCFCQCWTRKLFLFSEKFQARSRTAVQANITRPRSAIAAALYGAAIIPSSGSLNFFLLVVSFQAASASCCCYNHLLLRTHIWALECMLLKMKRRDYWKNTHIIICTSK